MRPENVMANFRGGCLPAFPAGKSAASSSSPMGRRRIRFVRASLGSGVLRMWVLLPLPVAPAQYLANLSCKLIRQEWFFQEIPSVQTLLGATVHYFLGIPRAKEEFHTW